MASAWGFKTTAPVSREQRRTRIDRDAREKQNLADRRIGFQRHPAEPNPIAPQRDSAGWISNEDRLHTDVVGELKAEYNKQFAHKQNVTENRNQLRTQREQDRWNSFEDAREKEAQRWAAMQGTSRRNLPSVGYNIVDHTWGDGLDADRLRFREEAARWRASNRANDLYQKSNNPEGYNVVTGEDTHVSVPVPPKPVPPPGC
eukprot:NODE_5360_length_704_cov_308.611785_g5337_i0.p1 GENE.NODE_5360_length_704_cov_308.611785_g5337_i0~~NODE_5360_length_704_cov_308.611785_g5337_i0.p1  ORF type:complete len:224 (+),score=25.43 NODE_5360_length_704_cov_308.611785_g5337_i0:67-672(+)